MEMGINVANQKLQTTFLLLFLGVLLTPACGTVPAKAPFAYVPSSMKRGSLKGPFSGRVVDAGSKKPVSNAVVYASWGYSRGVGVKSPTGYLEYRVTTDEDGRFTIPAVDEIQEGYPMETKVQGGYVLVPGKGGSGSGKGRLTTFRIVVYKKGYVAYRSDRVFATGEPRLNFAQHNNRVLLERWTPEMSHLRHVRFIGAVDRLGKVALWELQAAQAEMEGRADSPESPDKEETLTLLDASELFEIEDLPQMLGVEEEDYTVKRLKAVPRSKNSDSKHFKAIKKPESHDLAYRIWKVSPNRISRRYRRLLATYPNTRPVDQIGDRSFEASSKGILAHVFLDKKSGVLVSVTCGVDLCKTQSNVLKVTKTIHRRLNRLRTTDQKKEPPSIPDVKIDPLKGKNKSPFVPRLDR